MKKYIRTNDMIYEVTDWNEDGSCWCLNDGGVYLRKENIIKQADTIEELCDGFYLDDKLLKKFNKYGIFEKDEFKKFNDLFLSYLKGKIPVEAKGFKLQKA